MNGVSEVTPATGKLHRCPLRSTWAWHYPVPQATSRTLRASCCFSSATTQLLYSWVLLRVSPMYSCHTLAALPSAYWSGRPTAATPRERVLNTLSTDMPLLVPASSSRRSRGCRCSWGVFEGEPLVWQVLPVPDAPHLACYYLLEKITEEGGLEPNGAALRSDASFLIGWR